MAGTVSSRVSTPSYKLFPGTAYPFSGLDSPSHRNERKTQRDHTPIYADRKTVISRPTEF